jgi:putative N6-adenine-specific DNA methylase
LSVPWEFFLTPGGAVQVLVTLHDSNLKHSGRVAEVILDSAARRLKELGWDPPRPASQDEPAQRVMVRGVERRAMISLDMSGRHLHMRGYRRAAGSAPLREDLASALLFMCGYDGTQTLLDPMCGAGTLAIEAALIARRLAPGASRDFALEDWPGCRRPAWEHLRRQAEENALTAAPGGILAADRSDQALKAAAANTKRAGVSGDIQLSKADFFASDPPPGPPGVVVINPPYGRRLMDPKRAAKFQRDLAEHLGRSYAGWRVGMVLAKREWADLWPLEDGQYLEAPHGGIKITLLTGRLPA